MACLQTPYQRYRNVIEYEGQWPSFISVDGPNLFLSNSPENVAPVTTPATLYKAAYAIGSTPTSFRCYVWHGIDPSADLSRNVALILGATSPVTISNLRWQSDNTADVIGTGVCTSCAQLYDTYETNGTTLTVLGDIVIASCAAVVDSGSTFGCVLEFDASTSQPFGATLQLWTVAYDDDLSVVPNTFAAPIVPFVVGHPRGNWSHGDGLFYGGAFDVLPNVGPEMLQLICCDAGRIEELTYNSWFNPSGTTNEGLYGVNLTYRFSISNSTESNLKYGFT